MQPLDIEQRMGAVCQFHFIFLFRVVVDRVTFCVSHAIAQNEKTNKKKHFSVLLMIIPAR